MFEITKNVGNFCGEESFFAIKIVFDFFFWSVLESPIFHYFKLARSEFSQIAERKQLQS